MSNLCEGPLSVVTLGLESFNQSLIDQEVEATWIDWRPPAGGNQRLLEILEQMR